MASLPPGFALVQPSPGQQPQGTQGAPQGGSGVPDGFRIVGGGNQPPAGGPDAGGDIRSKLAALKASSPEAQALSDAQFAVAMHQRYFPNMPMVDYLGKVGLDRGDVLYELRKPGDQYGDYLRQALEARGGGETDEQAATRYGGAIPEDRPGNLDGVARAALQGATFGFGDEIVAGGAALLDPVIHGDRGKDFQQRFDTYMSREQGAVDNFREDNPIAAYGTEIAAAIPTALAGPANLIRGGSTAMRTATGVGVSAAEGALYGFGAGEGSFEDRAKSAGVGAALGGAAGVLVPAGFRMVANSMQKGAQKAATSRAVKAAPTAQTIKRQSQAGYRASEATGAEISSPAASILNQDARAFAQSEGLLLPSGQVADGFPKFSGALRTIEEFSAAPLNMKQAQTVQRAIRRVAKSTDPEEARLGSMLLDSFENYMDSLPPSAFTKGDGPEAMRLWQQARGDWARFRRTETVENIIADARLHDGGFAAGIRSGFKSVLKSKKKQRGFTQADLTAMREYVDGGPLEGLLKHLGSGGSLSAGMLGHVVAGPVAGATMAGAKLGTGWLARRALNNGARRTASQVRASVATPGGLPQIPGMSPQSLAIADMLTRAGGSTGASGIADGKREAIARALLSGGM